MKKTLIASAVAAAALSTSAFAMDPASELAAKLDSMPTVYGNIQLAAIYADGETSVKGTPGSTTGASAYEFIDNGSTIGFKHSHEIAPGVTGYLKAEFEFDGDRQKGAGNGLNRGDQAYIGAKGDFGDVKAGSYDTIVEDAIDDAVADLFEALYGTDSFTPTDEGDTITYTTPSMSGFKVAVAAQVNGENDNTTKKNGRIASMAVASYEMDQTKVSLAFDSADNTDQKSVYGLAVTQGLGDLTVGASYQTQDDMGDIYSLSGVYVMGANQFILAYQYGDYDNKVAIADSNRLTAQALHNVSDNMYVYVEAQLADTSAQSVGGTEFEGTSMALGATYVF